MNMIKAPAPIKQRGKWNFIPDMGYDDCLLFETEKECDNARRAMHWHGFGTRQQKTREGWKIWKVAKQ